MAKISIIGGSGFIGTELIYSLKADHVVWNLDKASSIINNDITSIADICDKSSLRAALAEDTDIVILLAAEHKDDVSPASLYYEVNVTGTKNVLEIMNEKGIRNIIFTSSVAVYGLDKENPDETHPQDPFNHYGKSKWEAEEILRRWYGEINGRGLVIIRPTVVFGPRNRGNVYNLLHQIASGKFMMIGYGGNKKSMAYVENIVGFIKFCIIEFREGYQLFNYADKPDLSTSELVKQAEISLGRKISPIRIPYFVGYAGGAILDLFAKILRRKFSISAVRVKKFCATTQFSAEKLTASGYNAPFTLQEGLDKTIKSIIEDNKVA